MRMFPLMLVVYRRHIESYMNEKEVVKDRYLTLRTRYFHNLQFSKLFCVLNVFGKVFHQLNNWHVVKQQYNSLNESHPRFHSWRKLHTSTVYCDDDNDVFQMFRSEFDRIHPHPVSVLNRLSVSPAQH